MTPFKTLAQARKAGWSTRCENIGPEDWPHYGVSIYHAARGFHDYLMSADASWTLQDARLAAIVKINAIEGICRAEDMQARLYRIARIAIGGTRR